MSEKNMNLSLMMDLEILLNNIKQGKQVPFTLLQRIYSITGESFMSRILYEGVGIMGGKQATQEAKDSMKINIMRYRAIHSDVKLTPEQEAELLGMLNSRRLDMNGMENLFKSGKYEPLNGTGTQPNDDGSR